MSSPFMSLMKVSLKQTFDLRGKNKKNMSLLVPIILILIFGSVLSALYGLIISIALIESEEALTPTLYAMAGFASMLALTTCIPKVKSTLFAGNDYEMLAAMPIKKRHIIFTKFLSLYLIELLYSFVCVFPNIIVISILDFEFLAIIEGLLLVILTPVIPLMLAGVIGMLISLVSDRFKFGNIITIILYSGFLVAVMFLSMSMSSSQNATDMLSSLSFLMWINPSTMLLNLPIGLNALAYIGVNILVLSIFVICLAKCYYYFHFLITASKTVSKRVEKEAKVKGKFKALFVLDLKRYFTSKTYLLNTITGGILTIVLVICLLVSFNSIEEVDILVEIKPYAVLFSLMILWCVGIAVPSAVAINFEGKTFWQIKTLPISFKQYSYSKVLLSYIVLAPFVLASSIILIFFSDFLIMNIITILLLPQLYLLLMCLLGFIINTIYYKLNWSNEMEAVKNSKGMILSMLIDFGLTIVISGVMIAIGLLVDMLIGCILALGITALCLICGWILFEKYAVKNISKIEA